MKIYCRGIIVFIISFCLCSCTSATWASTSLAQISVPAASSQMKIKSGAPTGLRLNVVTNGVHLVWNLPSCVQQVTGFEIVRATLLSGPYSLIATVDGNIREHTDSTAASEHIYFYKVRALTADGPTDFSIPAVAEISGIPDK